MKMLRLSDTIYRALLNLYPASFRHEYGSLMVQVFRDQRRDALRESGMLGLIRLWLRTVADLATTIPTQHMEARKRRPVMPSSTFSQTPNHIERFTQRARRALNLAQEEAQRFQHSYVGGEHLLLGLLREGEGVAGYVLRQLGVQEAQLEEVVKNTARPGDKSDTYSLAPGTKQSLEFAVVEARSLKHHYIGTEHLLLGLLRAPQSNVLIILRQLGLAEEVVRQKVHDTLANPPAKRWQHNLDPTPDD